MHSEGTRDSDQCPMSTMSLIRGVVSFPVPDPAQQYHPLRGTHPKVSIHHINSIIHHISSQGQAIALNTSHPQALHTINQGPSLVLRTPSLRMHLSKALIPHQAGPSRLNLTRHSIPDHRMGIHSKPVISLQLRRMRPTGETWVCFILTDVEAALSN